MQLFGKRPSPPKTTHGQRERNSSFESRILQRQRMVGSGPEIDETRALSGGCEVTEASSCDNKRVEEARRARVAWLERLRRECGSGEEFQTARSQPLWTQLTSTSCSSSYAPYCPSPADLESIRQENRLHFQHLVDTEPDVDGDYSHLRLRDTRDKEYDWHTDFGYTSDEDDGGSYLYRRELQSQELTELELSRFYINFGDRLEVGQKIGGGGQADIHEAIYDGKILDWCVLKVFRCDYLLADLQRLWVKDLVSFRTGFETILPGHDGTCCGIKHGTLLQDGRFAFVLQRCWGDLRRAIDLEIVKDKTHQSSPFPTSSTVKLMMHIAYGMGMLHRRGILHKDLKAANCLLLYNHEDRRLPNLDACLVADFESCASVVGTGFWRAPEILLALKKKEGDINSIPKIWTMKADVYGYAMTCYEILTGCIPFEDCAANDYDGVIGGVRPPLPDYIDPELQELLRRCWHSVPYMRPTFKEIVLEIKKAFPNYFCDWFKSCNFFESHEV